MLFGHQDNVTQQSAAQVAPTGSAQYGPAPAQGVNPLAVDPDTGASLPTVPPDSPGPVDTPHDDTAVMQDDQSVLNQPSAPGYTDQQPFSNDPAPTSPFGNDQASGAYQDYADGAPTAHLTPAFSDGSAAVALTDVAQQEQQHYTGQSFSNYTASDPAAVPVDPAADDLLGIKQQALAQLGSLVGHLDQSPEEKFRTTMMLIQSTDNAALLKDAYEAAQAIPDEKARAQALLDVVNEINYFTQQQQGQTFDTTQSV